MNEFLTLFSAVLGAVGTYYLAQTTYANAIRASSLLTLVAYLLCWLVGLDAEYWSLVFFGGSFVGMSTPLRFGLPSVCVAAILFGVFFVLIIPYISGIGGALGCSSFLSVCLTHLGILVVNAATSKYKMSSSVD
jgi:hypothetical protein